MPIIKLRDHTQSVKAAKKSLVWTDTPPATDASAVSPEAMSHREVSLVWTGPYRTAGLPGKDFFFNSVNFKHIW